MSDTDLDLAEQTEEGFLSRWSRRKQEDDQEPQDELALSDEHVDDTIAEEEYLPDDSDMPPIESLDEESDYSGFMSPKVSEGLRILALRKLFHGEAFNIRDGLDDYDDDFTSFAKLGNIVTAEMRRQMERVKEAMDSDDEEQVLDEEIDIEELEADAEEMTAVEDIAVAPESLNNQNDEVVEDELSDENGYRNEG
jgi:hypothetical protein